MEKFKGDLKNRLKVGMAFNGLAIMFIALTAIYANKVSGNSTNISDMTRGMIHGFQVGMFVGIQMVALVYMAKYRKALGNEEELKKLYIEENDERTKLIEEKVSGVGFNFALCAVAIATVIAGFFNQIVFFTLCGVLIFIVLVKVFFKIYYRNKF